jgi:lysophospholipase L1-like esterase
MLSNLKNTLLTLLLLTTTLLHAQPSKIMPLGDSITFGLIVADDDILPEEETGGYRYYLWHMLHDANYETSFVGSLSAGSALTPPFDTAHEGHRGWNTYELADNTAAFLTQNPADTILLHAGTNDISVSAAGINQILDQIGLYEQQSGQSIKVYVALIINERIPTPIITLFNENLKELVGIRIRNGDNLTLVDMAGRAGLTGADYSDNAHPNENGYQKMAKVWFDAITGPDTPGLYAYPYILVDGTYIHEGSVVVNYGDNSVSFETDIPENGITIY